MTSKTVRSLIAVTATALIAGLAVTGTTSVASAARVRVVAVPTTISVSDTKVPEDSTVKLSGRTTVRKRTVVLQKVNLVGNWKTVDRTRSTNGRYSFKVKVVEGSNQFRAFSVQRRVTKRLVLKKMTSRTVNVRGFYVAPPEPPVEFVETDPTTLAQVAFMTRTLVNNHRVDSNIPLKFANNTCLGEFAMTHSKAMAQNEELSHSPDPFFASIGSPSILDVCSTEANQGRSEVLALVYAETADEAAQAALNAWLASPEHRAIIEDAVGQNLQMGVGAARTSDGYWWVTGAIAFTW